MILTLGRCPCSRRHPNFVPQTSMNFVVSEKVTGYGGLIWILLRSQFPRVLRVIFLGLLVEVENLSLVQITYPNPPRLVIFHLKNLDRVYRVCGSGPSDVLLLRKVQNVTDIFIHSPGKDLKDSAWCEFEIYCCEYFNGRVSVCSISCRSIALANIELFQDRLWKSVWSRPSLRLSGQHASKRASAAEVATEQPTPYKSQETKGLHLKQKVHGETRKLGKGFARCKANSGFGWTTVSHQSSWIINCLELSSYCAVAKTNS